MRTIKLTEPMLTKVFEHYFDQMIYCTTRLENLNRELEQLAESPEYKEVVGVLSCFHGIKALTAITIITEFFSLGVSSLHVI
jgi:hypothetical protein